MCKVMSKVYESNYVAVDVGKNFNIFGVDNNSSMHTDNRKNKF